jgi:hypothetical protein
VLRICERARPAARSHAVEIPEMLNSTHAGSRPGDGPGDQQDRVPRIGFDIQIPREINI